MTSKAGSLSANSNGTFFQESEKGTLEKLTEDLSNIKYFGAGYIFLYYPPEDEVHAISDHSAG